MNTEADHREFLRALGARIAEFRRARKLTQEQLAELVGVDPQTIQRAETGRTALSLLRLRSIASALGGTLAELLSTGDGQLNSVPESPWPDDELRAALAYRAIPTERKPWAVKMLKALGKK